MFVRLPVSRIFFFFFSSRQKKNFFCSRRVLFCGRPRAPLTLEFTRVRTVLQLRVRTPNNPSRAFCVGCRIEKKYFFGNFFSIFSLSCVCGFRFTLKSPFWIFLLCVFPTGGGKEEEDESENAKFSCFVCCGVTGRVKLAAAGRSPLLGSVRMGGSVKFPAFLLFDGL